MSSNAADSTKNLTTASAIGAAVGTPLETPKAGIRNGALCELVIEMATKGTATDMRVRIYTSHRKEPKAFTTGGNSDWAPLTVASYTTGVATMDIFEASFVANLSDDSCHVVTFRATGVWMIAELYDAGAAPAGSSVTTRVYLREEG